MPVSVLHLRVCVPLPQAPHLMVAVRGSLSMSPSIASHICPGHAVGQVHAFVQACVPFEPQSRVLPGAQSPTPMQLLHVPQAPVAGSQLRVRVPQLPQLPVEVSPVGSGAHF
jgi:hypothetical protein